MGFRKFVMLFFLSPPPFSYSLVNGKMSNAIRRGEDDELERASERKGWVGGWMEET